MSRISFWAVFHALPRSSTRSGNPFFSKTRRSSPVTMWPLTTLYFMAKPIWLWWMPFRASPFCLNVPLQGLLRFSKPSPPSSSKRVFLGFSSRMAARPSPRPIFKLFSAAVLSVIDVVRPNTPNPTGSRNELFEPLRPYGPRLLLRLPFSSPSWSSKMFRGEIATIRRPKFSLVAANGHLLNHVPGPLSVLGLIIIACCSGANNKPNPYMAL